MLTGPEVVLLHAYKKQRQKELETAERRMDEVVARRR
jgi:phage-related protein